MKLASLKDGRDGRLVVVSKDLTRAVDVDYIAPTLQAALDDWANIGPQLAAIAEEVELSSTLTFRFREHDCVSPLPRAYQWACCSAYLNHVELTHKARGAEAPASFKTDPLIYQGGSDRFLSRATRFRFPGETLSLGLDLDAGIAVITGDVPMGVTPEAALLHIRLIMLVNDITYRGLTTSELAKGSGFFQSKPASAFSPVAVTPSELGAAWDHGKVKLPLMSSVNGALLGKPNAAEDMTFDFGQLIAHAARTRSLAEGTIIGCGTVSNRAPDGELGKPVAAGGAGYSCIAEQRAVEKLLNGDAETPFLRIGDVVRIEMLDSRHHSIFGAIEQEVVAG